MVITKLYAPNFRGWTGPKKTGGDVYKYFTYNDAKLLVARDGDLTFESGDRRMGNLK